MSVSPARRVSPDHNGATLAGIDGINDRAVQATRLSKARALTGVTIPMHPAAARYFAKAGAKAAPVADAPLPATPTP